MSSRIVYNIIPTSILNHVLLDIQHITLGEIRGGRLLQLINSPRGIYKLTDDEVYIPDRNLKNTLSPICINRRKRDSRENPFPKHFILSRDRNLPLLFR